MISVLMPSRKRTRQLVASVSTLHRYADNARSVEILVAADPDDPETQHNAMSLGVSLYVAPERHGYSKLYEYYNALADRSRGDVLLLWNDDASMTTHGWDTKIREMPAEALVGDLQHNLSPEYVCFPAMRRSMYEALGHYTTATPHIDSYIQDIARALGRIRPVDAYVQHDRPDLVGGERDSTYLEGRTGLRHQEYFDPNGPVQAAIAEGIRKIQEAGI